MLSVPLTGGNYIKKEKADKFMFNQVVINTRIGWNKGPHGLNNMVHK